MGWHAVLHLCGGIIFFRFASVLLPVCVLGLRVQRVLSGVEEESNMKPRGGWAAASLSFRDMDIWAQGFVVMGTALSTAGSLGPSSVARATGSKRAPQVHARCDIPQTSARRVTGFSVLLVSRASLELVCRDSKACPGYLASPAPLGRRETLEDREFLESMAPSAPQASRGSEVTSYGQIQLVAGKGPVSRVASEPLRGPSKCLLNEW